MVRHRDARLVTIVLFDGFAATDAVGPADVFAAANSIADAERYRLRYVAKTAHIRASNGMEFRVARFPVGRTSTFDTLIVPGADEAPLRTAMSNQGLMHEIARLAKSARRVCSVCSGAFLLAELGLLDGRTATTHWRGLDMLAAWRDDIKIDRDALFIEDGYIWTSAGVTAGIDMALTLIERDCGRAIAIAVARELVMFMMRPGGTEPVRGAARSPGARGDD